MCTACSVKCRQHDERCPLCRAPASKSDAEWLRRVQKHVDEGNNAEAQIMLGGQYFKGGTGVQQNFMRAFALYELAADNARAQNNLGSFYAAGQGVEVDHETAVQWFRRAAEQGYPPAQCNLGIAFSHGIGVAQSYDEAVKWFRLAEAQGFPEALYNLGVSYENGKGGAGPRRGAPPLQARRGNGARQGRGAGRKARGAPRGGAPRSTDVSVDSSSPPARIGARIRAGATAPSSQCAHKAAAVEL
jgi:TPR repeat protein